MSQDFFQSRCSYCHPSFFTKFFFLSHRLTSPVQRLIVSYLRSRLMTSFPARSAFTTAEQTEATLIFFILHVLLGTKSSASWPTSARHFSVFCVFCGLNFVLFRTTIVHFLVFSQRFFSMATSFRMTSFASREAMTTAEPPELLTFQYSEFIMYKHNL